MLNMIQDDRSPARLAYRRALDARDHAEKGAKAARQAVERGEAAIRQALDARARLAPVSDAVARHRAAGIRSGEGAQALLPANLVTGRKALNEADQFMSEVRSAQAQLAAELAEADARLAAARDAIRPAGPSWRKRSAPLPI